MPSLAKQKSLFNSRWATDTRPKRWLADPILKKKGFKPNKKRKPTKRHTVKAHKRGKTGGFLPHGSTFVGGSFSKHGSQRIFQGNETTYYKTRPHVKQRRKIDYRGRLAMKSGRRIG